MTIPLAMFAAAPAIAQERPPEPFTGTSVVAIAGVDHSSQTGADGTGAMYGGAATYDIATGSTRFGIEAEIGDASTSKCESSTVARYCAKAGRDLYIGGRIGKVVSPTTMLYAKAGYTNARVSSSYDLSSTVASPDFAGAGDEDGVRVGAGAEVALGSVLFRAEYRYSNYSSTYQRHQGVVGIGFRF